MKIKKKNRMVLAFMCLALWYGVLFSGEPINRGFDQISLGMSLDDVKAKVGSPTLEVEHEVMGPEEKRLYIPSMSARPGIEGVYCLFYQSRLYQIVIQYNESYTVKIHWDDFVSNHLQRYGEAFMDHKDGILMDGALLKMAPFAYTVIRMNGFFELTRGMVWTDQKTSLGVFEGKVVLRGERHFHGMPPAHPDREERVENHYIAVFSDNKVFKEVPKKKFPEKKIPEKKVPSSKEKDDPEIQI